MTLSSEHSNICDNNYLHPETYKVSVKNTKVGMLNPLVVKALLKVVIDDTEYEMQSPVMNGSNPVKDNSMSQQRVWNSMCRSFVKCVAIHTGLGFNLWLKEEMQPFNNIIPKKEEKRLKN